MRRRFAEELLEQMFNKDIYLITANLGYKMFDDIAAIHQDRFIDVGVSEQAAVGMAVGLASEGKIPIVYSITPFVLYRPFELIRNYLNEYQYPVKLVGAGRDRDYSMDGFSHWSEDAKYFLDGFPNIVQFWPDDELPMKEFLYNLKPSFMSLRR